MKLFHRLPPPGRVTVPCVLSIGNFDGMHRGHQAILQRMLECARAARLPSALLLFEPQPLEFLRPREAPVRLTLLREKLVQIAALGIDQVYCMRFNRSVSRLEACAFINDLLLPRLPVSHLFMGEDFRFGRGRGGDVALLRQLRKRHGYDLESVPQVLEGGRRISSTQVRRLLAAGDLHGAQRLLGRPYGFCGRVTRGDRKGRLLGFPTANLSLRRPRAPLGGVFASRVYVGEKCWEAVSYLGSRPHFNGTAHLLESHLLDYAGDLYRRLLRVELLERLRGDGRFASDTELVHQMERDRQQARRCLGGAPPVPRAAHES